MFALHIEHPVHDFATWKAAFDGDPVGRRAGGVRAYRVTRSTDLDAATRVAIDLEFDDDASAAAFRERLQRLWAGAGAQGLGIGAPAIRLEEIVDRG